MKPLELALTFPFGALFNMARAKYSGTSLGKYSQTLDELLNMVIKFI
jgi:hypothetical protein